MSCTQHSVAINRANVKIQIQTLNNMKIKRYYSPILFILIIVPWLFASCSFVRLSKFNSDDCKKSCGSGVISKKKDGNTTTIVYGKTSLCCLKMRRKIRYKNTHYI